MSYKSENWKERLEEVKSFAKKVWMSQFFKGLRLNNRNTYIIYLILLIGILVWSYFSGSMWYVSWPAWLLGIIIIILSPLDIRMNDKRFKTGFKDNETEDDASKSKWNRAIVGLLLIIFSYLTA